MPKINDEILDTTSQNDTNPRYTIRNNTGDVIQDNVQIELKTPVLQEGTPLNKVFFNQLFTYEEMQCTTINHTYQQPVSRQIFFEIQGITKGSKTIYGSSTENLYDVAKSVDFKITTTATNGWMQDNATENGYDSFYGVLNGSTVSTTAQLNSLLLRTERDSSYYIKCSKYTGNSNWVRTFSFDFRAPRQVTLKFRAGYAASEFTFSGSNDNSSWTRISTLTGSGAQSVPSETAYRYYKIESKARDEEEIYYMYFTDVSDTETIPDYENVFTIDNDIIPYKRIYVKTPSNMRMTNVTKSSINGISVDPFEQRNTLHKLYYNPNTNSLVRKSGIEKITVDMTSGSTITGTLNNAQALIATVKGNGAATALIFPGDTSNLSSGVGTTLYTRLTMDSSYQYTITCNTASTVHILVIGKEEAEW